MGRPTVKNEINWSTLALAVGMAVTVGGMVYNGGRFSEAVLQVQETAANERDAIRADMKVMSTDISGLVKLDAKYDQLVYRISAEEQASADMADAIEDMKQALADLGADTRVIREILTRLDKQAGN